MKALKDIIKKLDYILNAKQKRQYFLVMAIALIGSFWELLGVSAIFPFIESLMQPDKVSKAWYYPFLEKCFGVPSL